MDYYHNPRCRKSREGLQLLHDKGIEPNVIEYLKDTPSKNDFKELLSKLNIKAIDLVRRNESIWKENYKNKELSESETIEIMLSNPKLIERPILVNGNKAIVGRPPELLLNIL